MLWTNGERELGSWPPEEAHYAGAAHATAAHGRDVRLIANSTLLQLSS